MDNRRNELISKYNTGSVSNTELREIETLIHTGVIDVTDLRDLTLLEERIADLDEPSPGLALDDAFYRMLADEKRSTRRASLWKNIFSSEGLVPRMAFASVILIIGFVSGYFMKLPAQKSEISSLTKEVANLKEMMMLSLLEKESASERLKAVSLTEEMSSASGKVTQALLQTLNNDANINVRLAALDALKPYCKDSHIREELVRSLGRQESPLVQVALAELMAALQEKSSVKELQKILQDERTPRDVKSKIKKTITVLT